MSEIIFITNYQLYILVVFDKNRVSNYTWVARRIPLLNMDIWVLKHPFSHKNIRLATIPYFTRTPPTFSILNLARTLV